MALYIRDDSVNELASLLARTTGKTKTEAVREALEQRLKTLRTPETLHERVARIQAQVRAWGGRPRTPEETEADKRFMDEMWGEE